MTTPSGLDPGEGRISGRLPLRNPQAIPPPREDLPPDPLTREQKSELARRALNALLEKHIGNGS